MLLFIIYAAFASLISINNLLARLLLLLLITLLAINDQFKSSLLSPANYLLADRFQWSRTLDYTTEVLVNNPERLSK